MISLAGDVSGHLIIDTVFFESAVAGIAPQDASHTKVVGTFKRLSHLNDLTAGVLGTEINCSSHRGGSEIPCIPDAAKHNLVVLGRISKEFVVVEFNDEGDFMGVLPRHHGEITECSGDGIATTFNGKPDNVFRIEIHGVGGKRSPCGMLDTLINRKNGKITRSR